MMSLRSSNYFFFFSAFRGAGRFFHSTFLPRETFYLFHWGDVGRSMFDVYYPEPLNL